MALHLPFDGGAPKDGYVDGAVAFPAAAPKAWSSGLFECGDDAGICESRDYQISPGAGHQRGRAVPQPRTVGGAFVRRP
jgi:hypothetical protein